VYIRIVTFRLADLPADSYEALADAFSTWPGLRSKLWLADATPDTYGGVYLFDDRQADASRHTDLFTSMTANPHFAELHIAEHGVLADPSARAGRPLALPGEVTLPSP
jgi:hypothetical protein